jgi:hypothetical protein
MQGLVGRPAWPKFSAVAFQRQRPSRMTDLMIRFGLACVLALTCLLAGGGPVLADCSDVPAPGVYWRRCVQDSQDLRGVDLTGASLRDASFKRADLSDAILNDIEGQRAKFVSSVMQNTRLDGANLVRADLTNADLTGASLVGADLTSARFFGADLSRADLTGAHLGGTDLLKASLAGATWVDGKTICAEDSIGQCHPMRPGHSISEAEPSG